MSGLFINCHYILLEPSLCGNFYSLLGEVLIE